MRLKVIGNWRYSSYGRWTSLAFELKKSLQFSNDIILVDGAWGVGKSAVTPFIGAFKNVEKKRIDPVFEYVAILKWLNKLDDDAASTLLSIYADYFTYHNQIGREVNLRWSDDSGFRNSPGAFRYVARLFRRDGDHVESKIDDTNPATLIVSDFAVIAPSPLHAALGDRLKFIEVVRHPLYLVNYWTHYLNDFRRAREFSLSSEYHDLRIPWMASEWAPEYLEASPFDRVLLLIARSQDLLLQSIGEFPKCLVIPFESFVIETESWLQQIGGFLNLSLIHI